MNDTIELYGKKYAANDGAMVESLFKSGGTCNGYFKRTKAGNIYLSDMQGNERVFIRNDGLMVSVHRFNGKRRYLFSTSSKDDLWLGVPESYLDQLDGPKRLVQ